MNPKSLPKLDLNVTNDCNLRCVHCCFKSGGKTMGEMSLKQFEKLFTDFVALGGTRIDVTGGEPFMRRDILEIIEMAIRFKLRTELVTNSLLLNEGILRRLSTLGLPEMAVSIDGSTAEKHAQIRGTNSEDFKKIKRHLKIAADLGIKTKVNTVVFSTNLSDLSAITELAIELGAREHGFYYFSPIGRGDTRSDLVADPLDWLKMIREQLVHFRADIKLSLETPILESDLAAKCDVSCYLSNPWHLQILPDGNVYPCAIMAAYGRPLGSLVTKRLAKIWLADELHDGTLYREEATPLFEKFKSCVCYQAMPALVESGKFVPVCLCRKFKIDEVMR